MASATHQTSGLPISDVRVMKQRHIECLWVVRRVLDCARCDASRQTGFACHRITAISLGLEQLIAFVMPLLDQSQRALSSLTAKDHFS
jgi:hypothetical protein